MKMANQSSNTVKDRPAARPFRIATEQARRPARREPPGIPVRSAQAASTAGSPSIPEQWLSLHGDALFRFALLLVGDEHHAEDLVQETLLAALESHARYSAAASERTWLIAILRHKALDDRRRNRRRDQYLADCRSRGRRQLQPLRQMAQAAGPLDAGSPIAARVAGIPSRLSKLHERSARAHARSLRACAWSKALTQPRLAGYWKSQAPISGHCFTEPASGSAAVWKASGLAKRNADMFSCRQAVRRTLDMLERRLSLDRTTGSLGPSGALPSLPRAFASNPRTPLRPQTPGQSRRRHPAASLRRSPRPHRRSRR